MRRAALVAGAVLGLLAGATFSLAARAPSPRAASAPAAPWDAPPSDPVPKPSLVKHGVLAAWTPQGLPTGFEQAVRDLPDVVAVTAVRGDLLDLVIDMPGKAGGGSDQWHVPLDALAVDPAGYARFATPSSAGAFAALGQGHVLLGETSARLRGATPGTVLMLRGGEMVTVADVVDDAVVGAAELVVGLGDADRLGVRTERFLLIAYEGPRAEAEAAIRSAVPEGVVVRVRGPGETPYLRHGDAVLPQSVIKDLFGEFAFRRKPGGVTFEQDPAWTSAHIVTATVPVLGTVQCHRAVLDPLRRALQHLDQSGLSHLVDAASYEGCWNPRLIAPGAAVSRHAWGVAIDLNAPGNPTGGGGAQDQRLVAALADEGFTWGGGWLVPDPMHFEYAAPR